jgi:hypothetical protein
MAKEAKESNLKAKFEYDGIEMTIEKTVADYDIEDGTKALAQLVQLLAKGSEISLISE